jgi:hypothetical protein
LHNNILVTHLYKYTMVSKNKFILDIRSLYNSLTAFLMINLYNKTYKIANML